jgi:ribosomal 50S subunit-recycling heat shock protein
MRLDKFLKVSRIIKRRTVAKEACDRERVSLNGRPAKAGAEVSVGDEIEIRFGSSTLNIRVLSLKESVRKEDAEGMYEAIPR